MSAGELQKAIPPACNGGKIFKFVFIMKSLYLRKEEKFGNLIVQANVRLSDECKNGHQDFSLTGYIWEGRKCDSKMVHGGACGEELIKYFPELEIFERLHLCDFRGVPMCAVENGFYFINRGEFDKASKYLRVTTEEMNILQNCPDKYYFAYTLEKMGIVARWKEEAAEAIAYLENATGQIFEVDSPNLRDFVGSYEEIEEKIKKGYYTPEACAERIEAARIAKIEKAKAEVLAKYNKEIAIAAEERDVYLYVLNAGLPVDNFIFYNHTKKGVFNWRNYGDKITQEVFIDFINSVNYAELPEGVIFEIKQ